MDIRILGISKKRQNQLAAQIRKHLQTVRKKHPAFMYGEVIEYVFTKVPVKSKKESAVLGMLIMLYIRTMIAKDYAGGTDTTSVGLKEERLPN